MGEGNGAAAQGLQGMPEGSQPLPRGTKQRLRMWGLRGFQAARISLRPPFGMGEQEPSGYSQPLELPGGRWGGLCADAGLRPRVRGKVHVELQASSVPNVGILVGIKVGGKASRDIEMIVITDL